MGRLKMNEQYYVEYYDPKGRRGYTKYYSNKLDADNKADELKRQGYVDISVITFRY